MIKNGEKSIWKIFDRCVLKKIWQGVCCENFRPLVWKMAKLALLMLHTGQNWSKVILKRIWPMWFEKDQARALWWKFQLSSMTNDKVSIFDVAQWSNMLKNRFEKKFTTVLWKRTGKRSLVKISAYSMKNGKVSTFDVVKWSKKVKIQFKKKITLCYEKEQATTWWGLNLIERKSSKIAESGFQYLRVRSFIVQSQ